MGSLPIEPEDYALNANALIEQQRRVLEAQHRAGEAAKADVPEDEILEALCTMYKGKPLPEDWDPNSHPYFMTDVAAEEAKGNPMVEGFRALAMPDPPEEIAEDFKKKGNDALKRGPKYYRDAVEFYTQAITAKSPIAKNNSVYYSNRAAVQLLRKNYGKVVEDTEEALKLDDRNVKAYYRAARALSSLQKYNLCIEKCEAGLLIDPVNKDIKKELAVALARKKDKDDAAKKIEAANAKKLMEESSKGRKVRDAIKERGIVMGQVVFANPTKAEPTIDKEGHIHWPVLAVYPEFAQSDFMADVHEAAILDDCLALLFDPANPPEWDPAGRYVQGNLSVYYASEQSKPLEAQGKKKIDSDEDFINSLLSGSDRKGVEDDYARAAKSEWKKVDVTKPLVEILQEEGHVVGGFPVFQIVEKDSVYERHLLASPPDKV